MITPIEEPTVLITGGAGFIGSHLCLVLLQAGYRVVVLDNFSNSSATSVELVGGDALERPPRLSSAPSSAFLLAPPNPPMRR